MESRTREHDEFLQAKNAWDDFQSKRDPKGFPHLKAWVHRRGRPDYQLEAFGMYRKMTEEDYKNFEAAYSKLTPESARD